MKNLHKLLVLTIFLLGGLNVGTTSAFAETFFPSLSGKPQVKEKYFFVSKVISADTISVDDGHAKRIRLIGLTALEPPRQKNKEVDEFGIIIKEADPTTSLNEQALNFTSKLLLNKKVRLEFDVNVLDDRQNTIAYVFLEDGTFVNAEILRQGFANLKIRPPNTKYADQMREAYREARQEKRGLHGD